MFEEAYLKVLDEKPKRRIRKKKRHIGQIVERIENGKKKKVRLISKLKGINKDGTRRKPLTEKQRKILAAGRKVLAQKVLATVWKDMPKARMI